MPQRIVVTGDARQAVLFQVFPQPGGNTVQIARDVKAVLASAAAVVVPAGEPQITRTDLKRMVAVIARITGRDLGSTVKDVKAYTGWCRRAPRSFFRCRNPAAPPVQTR